VRILQQGSQSRNRFLCAEEAEGAGGIGPDPPATASYESKFLINETKTLEQIHESP